MHCSTTHCSTAHCSTARYTAHCAAATSCRPRSLVQLIPPAGPSFKLILYRPYRPVHGFCAASCLVSFYNAFPLPPPPPCSILCIYLSLSLFSFSPISGGRVGGNWLQIILWNKTLMSNLYSSLQLVNCRATAVWCAVYSSTVWGR